jgi:hypothetical protein
MQSKHHNNTLKRMKLVSEITRQHYEPGNLARCYKQVWRRFIIPIYPMCYRTYLNYLKEMGEYEERELPQERSLFDFI